MGTIKTKANQTVYDIAVERYGTCEAVGGILADNPAIRNDPAAMTSLGIDSANTTDFYIDIALEAGQQITIDDDSPCMKRSVIKELETDITTFNL